MKKDDLLTRLVAYYWTAKDFRRIQNEIGIEVFEEIDWRKEAALTFVCDNVKDCEFIFNHRRLTKCK